MPRRPAGWSQEPRGREPLELNAAQVSRRLWGLRLLLVAALVGLVVKLGYLQLGAGAAYEERALQNMLRRIPVPAPRGIMLDRRGRLIVRNTPSFAAVVLPAEVTNLHEGALFLSTLLDVPPAEVRKAFAGAEHDPYRPVLIKGHLDPPTVAKVAEAQAEMPGLYLESEAIRQYPGHLLGAHLIGYLGAISPREYARLKDQGYGQRDTIGKAGLERQYDADIRGVPGARIVQVDSYGHLVRMMGVTPPQAGNSLRLTIDWPLQLAAERALTQTLDALQKKNGIRVAGAVVALDPRTGAVLAMASQPGFDPNLFARGIRQKEYQALISAPLHPLLDHAISAAYPCGSTFKLITASAALQEGVTTRDTVWYCPGSFSLGGGNVFHCFVRSGHGSIAFVEAIAKSCDVTFYQIGYKLGITRLDKYAAGFGIGARTGIDLPGEIEGLLPTEAWKQRAYHDRWYPGETVNLSIGQGYLQVSPLQLAVATAAVANGGTLYKPFLVRQVVSPEGRIVSERGPEILRRVPVAPKALAIVREGMRGAVTHGTAAGINIPGVAIAGKTGTAETGTVNAAGRNHAWFTCFAPYAHPEIVITVCLEKSGGFGGQWAAPIARQLVEEYFHIKPSGTKGSSVRD